MKRSGFGILALVATLTCGSASFAANAVEPAGDPVLELPTVRCLGVSWVVRGADKASVEVQYREVGQEAWQQGPPLWRVDPALKAVYTKADQGKAKMSTTPLQQKLAQFEWQGGFVHAAKVIDVPDDCRLFSGSILMLKPDTAYQIKLTLKGPDGGGEITKTLESKTIAEPVDPTGGPMLYVVPGDGGGAGTKDDPYKGLDAAEAAAKPGDTFLLHAGKYQGGWVVKHSGEPGKPIVWRSAGDGAAIIDGQLSDAEQKVASHDFGAEIMANRTVEQRSHLLTGRDIDAGGIHDVWFEDLTLCNANSALVAMDSAHIVIRRCQIYSVWAGILSTKNSNGQVGGLFISDNNLIGTCSWPKKTKVPDDCGIWVSGAADVVCYNNVFNFGDGIQTYHTDWAPEDIDVYNNDVRQSTDNPLEMKDVTRNVRVFDNILTNNYSPISVAPVLGGPEYVFRNVVYNMVAEPFKIHNSPAGVLFYNNTIVEATNTFGVWTPAPVYNCVMRNNLFVANDAGNGIAFDPKMVNCDVDYCGLAWPASNKRFLKWNDKSYATLADAQADGLFRHSLILKREGLFAAKVEIPKDPNDTYQPPDVRLAPNSPAAGMGAALPGFTEPGKPVDLGAYPLGCELPHYGPRLDKSK